ncbi:hypothetical protein CAPTEDRAFT_95444 [Capitella teleta]|uniref:Selenoprotein O n=1 Tax=Capitella teleta TaxID=283909 RepID=R7V7W6_CAPTE|nr:hypothetical protein CAPTEDRAFT_95444 [Capitella teleta]|eukprot:ELU11840.1 hypothetical protein CAPTEDRAFT_95444 [Capitella teleta]
MTALNNLTFDNSVLRSLPIDPEEKVFPRQVKGACFSKVTPTPVENPQLVSAALPALQLLDLGEDDIEHKDFTEYFSGNKLLKGSETAAHCYCGHQFGHFAGQLGDGAAIYLGEIINKRGERWELQVKGAGLTPYSRQADGRKVLRSSIREFLCSEAMHHLGIPTTRAATCVTSDSYVVRDVFYSGNPVNERCTIVSRIAPSFLRFGSFQICKPPDRETGREGPSVCLPDVLSKLTNFTIEKYFPEIWEMHSNDKETAISEFFKEVVLRTARLVAEWQCIGFCHGVLNTDNMSILGLSIDYGPFGFMDRFDEDFICNGSDDRGRYTYKKQPEICKWNCQKLCDALMELIPLEKLLPSVELFDVEYQRCYMEKMRKKVGDRDLVASFLDTMQKTGADFTNCFRLLSGVRDDNTETILEELMKQSCSIEELRAANQPRMDVRQLQMLLTLAETNPGLLGQMGMAARGLMQELSRLEKLKELKEKTEDWKRKQDQTMWSQWILKYQDRLKRESDPSLSQEDIRLKRTQVMNSNNPKFVLRNYMAQNAIEAAEKGDFSEVNRVLSLLQNPFIDLDNGMLSSENDCHF